VVQVPALVWGDLEAQFFKHMSEWWCCWCLEAWFSQPPWFHYIASALLSMA